MSLPLPVLPGVIAFATVLGAGLALPAPARQHAQRARPPRSTTPAVSPTPAPPGTDAPCADAATAYEKTWMHYSEHTKSQTLRRRLQSSKTRLCDCMAKNYGYEGVLPQPLRAFCEDRAIRTPPYFPSRGERPPTAAP